MTQTTENSDVHQALASRTAAALIAGGLAWTTAGLLHADDGWRFDIAAVVWFAADVALLVGLLGLFVLRPHGNSRLGSAALVLACIARVTFAAGELVSLVDGNDEGPLIPVGALLTAVTLTTYGIVVLRRRHSGAGRWSLLVMGLYPIVAMFPVVAITGEPSTILIAGWGLPAALIGAAGLSSAR